MKKIITMILSTAIALSSLCAFGTIAFAEETDTYQYVNIAPKAKITYDGTIKSGDLNYLTDSTTAKTTTTVIADCQWITFDLGNAYSIDKFEITKDFRIVEYALSASNEENGNYTQLISYKEADAENITDKNGKKIYKKVTANINTEEKYRYYRISRVSETDTDSEKAFAVVDVKLMVNYNVLPKDCEYTRIISSMENPVTTDYTSFDVNTQANITDNNEKNQCAIKSTYMTYDMGAVHRISKFRCVYQGRNADNYVEFLGSKDGENYERIFIAYDGGNSDTPADTGDIYIDDREYRYIKLARPNGDTISAINELYVYEATPTEAYWQKLDANEYWFDASVGASVTGDAESWTNSPERSVDRDSSTAAVAKATYMLFDLGSTYELGGFEISYQYRADTTQLKLYASADNVSWTELYEIPRGNDRVDVGESGYFEHSNYRYIKLQADDDGGVFNIYELKMLGIGKKNGTENVALRKMDNIITNGDFNDTSALAALDLLPVDLGSNMDVKAVRIAYSDRNGHYTVYGSENGTDYIALTTFDGTSSSSEKAVLADTGMVYVKPGNYRYIKISNDKQKVINLYELAVYASKASGVLRSGITDNMWTFEYENNTANPYSFISIKAIYDGEELLKNVIMQNEVVGAYETVTKNYPVDKNTKGFLWKSIAGIESIAEAVGVSK